MKVQKLALLAPLALFALLPGPSGHTLEPHAALRQNSLTSPAFTFTINGRKQGDFMGDGSVREIRGLSYDLQALAPTDTASGQATGKRHYLPFIITKEWGPSSPQILTAMATNEILPAVQLTFTGGMNADGAILNHTITLTNARIVAVHHHPDTGMINGSSDKHQVEDISFVFQKIETHDYVGGTSSSDDLVTR